MSRCIDSLIHAADFIIAHGTIYDFLVSSINHAGRLDHIFALGFTGGMTQHRKCFRHTADFIATDLAVDNFVIATGDLTGGRNNVLFHCFAGSMFLGIDLKIVQLFNQFCAALICVQIFADCALPVLFHTGRGAGRFGFIVIFKRMVRIYRIPIFDHHIACLAICISGIAILSAAFRHGVADFSHDLMMMPCTIFFIVVYGRSGFHSGSLKICTVRVAQLRGGNCEFLAVTATVVLISCCLGSRSALLNILTGTALGANVCTACSRINSTDRSKSTVYIDLCISKIGIRAIVRLAGSICYRFELARTPNKVIGSPFIGIININVLSARHGKTGAFGNIHLNTCQKRSILIDGNTTGINVYGNVVRYRKNITCGVDAHSGKLQRQSVQFRLAIYRKNKTVGAFIIILCKTAGLDIEHSATTNKVYSCGVCCTHGIYTAEHLFCRTGIQSERYFNILNEVLGKREHLISHI